MTNRFAGARRSRHAHPEAFCVMQYFDDDGNVEFIWNSRDGVTPFVIISRQGLEAMHRRLVRGPVRPAPRPEIG